MKIEKQNHMKSTCSPEPNKITKTYQALEVKAMNKERARLREEGCSEREERKRVANLHAEFVFVSIEYF